MQFLTGEYRNPRLFDVTMALCVEMLISSKLAKDDAEARAKLQAVLDNGKAAEVFGRMVAAQKGPTDFVENYAKYLPTAMLTKAVYADTEGFVSEMDTRALGMGVEFYSNYQLLPFYEPLNLDKHHNYSIGNAVSQ